MMHSNLIMYLTAMSAVSIHNLANNIKEVTRSFETIDLKTRAHTGDWTLANSSKLIAEYPQCNGSRQSPVLIEDSKIRDNLNLRLGLTAYDKPMSGFLLNHFPTFRLLPFSYELPRPSALVSQSIARSFNPYADSHFVLNYIQFHWQPAEAGDNPASSPVHQFAASSRVNGSSPAAATAATTATVPPVEIHFVHTNTAYANLDEAFSRPDGLLIFAVMVLPSTHESYLFNRILDELANLTEHGQQVSFSEDSTWRSLLPADTSKFYRYQGSLIYPPCHESVQWIIFDDKLKLGHKQLRRLRRFRFLSKRSQAPPLTRASNNSADRQQATASSASASATVDWSAQLRPLQALNDRLIERSFRPPSTTQIQRSLDGKPNKRYRQYSL